MNRDAWHVTAAKALARVPTADGKRFAEVLTHGSLAVEIYAPRGSDPQSPHTRDEVYVILSGRGDFVLDGAATGLRAGRRALRPGAGGAPLRRIRRRLRDLGLLLRPGRRRAGAFRALTGGEWRPASFRCFRGCLARCFSRPSSRSRESLASAEDADTSSKPLPGRPNVPRGRAHEPAQRRGPARRVHLHGEARREQARREGARQELEDGALRGLPLDEARTRLPAARERRRQARGRRRARQAKTASTTQRWRRAGSSSRTRRPSRRRAASRRTRIGTAGSVRSSRSSSGWTTSRSRAARSSMAAAPWS